MSKILINIPEYMFNDIQDRYKHPNKGDGINLLEDAIVNGTVLPDNATNGDIIKTLFPKVQDVDIDWVGEDWWNSPYEVTDGN